MKTAIFVALLAVAAVAAAADVSGSWKASFDTQIGRQDYTYVLAVKGQAVTGKVTSANGESEIQNGRVEGDKITFRENLNYQGNAIAIDYTGTIVSDDEIKFTRQVGDFATEELVARRVKP